MNHIVQDKSGTLVSGVFYEFGVAFNDELPSFYDPAQSFISKRNPIRSRKWEHSYLWTEIAGGEGENRHDCPLDPAHVTANYWTNCILDVHGGSVVSQFVPESQQDLSIVSAVFAKQLQASGLSGVSIGKVDLNLFPDSAVSPRPPLNQNLFVLSYRGRNCERSLVVRGAPNACPTCGRAPLCCAGCPTQMNLCPKCNQVAWTTRDDHRGVGDRRLIVCPSKDRRPYILEGSRWDGNDFIFARGAASTAFITKRALDWLLSVHAAPFHATKALVNVDGMSPAQLEKLEAAKTLASLKSSK